MSCIYYNWCPSKDVLCNRCPGVTIEQNPYNMLMYQEEPEQLRLKGEIL